MTWFRLSSRDLAFVAVFAALSAIVNKILPGIPIVGFTGSTIKFDAAFAPIYGFVIGPYLGFLASFLGGVIVAGNWFDVLTSIASGASALVAGLLTQRNYRAGNHSIKSWIVAAAVVGLLILGFFATWVGQRAPLYAMLHIVGLLAILVTRGWTATSFKEGGEKEERTLTMKPLFVLCGISIAILTYFIFTPYLNWVWDSPPLYSLPIYLIYLLSVITILYGFFGARTFAAGIVLASYCGIIVNHMIGTLVWIETIGILIPIEDVEGALAAFGVPDVPSLLMVLAPVTAVERLILTTIATLIGVSLVMTLRKSGLFYRKL